MSEVCGRASIHHLSPINLMKPCYHTIHLLFLILFTSIDGKRRSSVEPLCEIAKVNGSRMEPCGTPMLLPVCSLTIYVVVVYFLTSKWLKTKDFSSYIKFLAILKLCTWLIRNIFRSEKCKHGDGFPFSFSSWWILYSRDNKLGDGKSRACERRRQTFHFRTPETWFPPLFKT